MAAVACKTAGAQSLSLGARLGLPVSAAEASCSLSPADYVYGAPTEAQLQRLLRQQMGASQGKAGEQPEAAPREATGYGPQAALQGAAPHAAAAAKPSCPLAGNMTAAAAANMEDLLNNHLALELDDDCLRILLGEDEDESRPCTSSGGSAKAGAGSGGSSEKSTATADMPTAGEAEAASLPFAKDEEDDIAMLFGEFSRGGTASIEPLDLHLLGAGPLAADDSDSASQAEADAGSGLECEGEMLEAAAEAGAGLKRPKSAGSCGATSPSGRGLMLSMNYEKAAESINLELLGVTGRKTPPCDSFEAMLPLLSPAMDFAAIHTPESPDSLASGCDIVVQPPINIKRQDSSSKRKRAVKH